MLIVAVAVLTDEVARRVNTEPGSGGWGRAVAQLNKADSNGDNHAENTTRIIFSQSNTQHFHSQSNSSLNK